MVSPYLDLTRAGPLFDAHAAIDARLRLAFPPREFEHATMPARMTPAGWSALVRRTPFVGLGWIAAVPKADNGRLFEAAATWSLVLINRNSAGHKERLLGDALAAGQIGMAQVAAVALHGMTIKDVGAVVVTGVNNLWIEGWEETGSTVTGIDLSVNFSLPVAAPTGTIDDYLRHAAAWVLDPAAEPAREDLINVRDPA